VLPERIEKPSSLQNFIACAKPHSTPQLSPVLMEQERIWLSAILAIFEQRRFIARDRTSPHGSPNAYHAPTVASLSRSLRALHK